jgi:hypothetical protein
VHCSQVTDLLSLYVDDALDGSTRERIEQHLAHCKTCTEELASLRTYLEAMAALPKVQAPADFLEGVHARLEQPGFLKTLAKWLFVPLRVKIPFEVAGVVMASLLLVFMYRGLEIGKENLPPPSPVNVPLPSPPPLPEKAKPVMGMIELVVRLKPAAKLQASPEPELSDQSREAKRSTDSVPPMQEKSLMMKAAPAPMRAAGKAEELAPDVREKTISQIRNLVEQASGSILSPEPHKEALLPQVIVAQIPARGYPLFLEELDRLGQLEQPVAKITVHDKDALIQIQIRLVPSR